MVIGHNNIENHSVANTKNIMQQLRVSQWLSSVLKRCQFVVLTTFFGFFEEQRHERFLGFSHQLDYAFLDRVFVLVQPTLDVVRHLRNIFSCFRIKTLHKLSSRGNQC